MPRAIFILAVGFLSLWLSAPSFAGMKKDLRDCAAADRAGSAAACTRIMASGRLPKRQFYIAYFNRGWAHRNTGNTAKALADFDRAAKRHPTYARTYFSRALVHNDLGNFTEAVRDLDRAIELKAGDWSAHFNRAVILRKLGRDKDALADLDRAAQLKQDERKVGVLRALVLAELGQSEAAKSQLDTLGPDKGNRAEISYVRGVMDLTEGRLSDALAHANAAIDLETGFTAAHALKGRIMEGRGDVTAAKSAYHRALAEPAHHLDGQKGRATARERIAQLTGDALPTQKSTLQDRPATQPVVQRLGCRRYVPTASLTISVACEE